ncbi:hypothetical protein C8R43DRAFT_847506, partial [Mycena crocata]
VIVAGDFAQLPPMTGHSLYNGLVALSTSQSMTQKAQNAVLGRILWHQFNTVVILRQNMRQKLQTDDDAKLRTALENMRYAACHPHLNSKEYRNVSVITAWNIHKDAINDEGAERFARDTGQELIDFYSVDKLSSRAVDRYKWSGCEQAHYGKLGPKLQARLWSAFPTANTEQVPGKLRLCVGMPV